jgi:ABC-type Fe3+ transport system permease subunit
VRFLGECICLAALIIIVLLITRRSRWDVSGSLMATGTLAILIGVTAVFFGWLVSRSEWLGQSRSVLWVGGALLLVGLMILQFLPLLWTPVEPSQGESPKPSFENQESGSRAEP